MSTDQLLTPAEVAAILFVDPKTVTRWARAGKLDAIRTPGGHRRYLKSDVLAIMTGEHHSQNADRSNHGQGVSQVLLPRPAGDGLDATNAAVVSEAVAVALEAEAEEAADAVIVTAAAVAAAAEKAAVAAGRAREARAFAAAEAARSVAAHAVRNALGIQAEVSTEVDAPHDLDTSGATQAAGVAVAARKAATVSQVPSQRGS